jgi:hypothetical protein
MTLIQVTNTQGMHNLNSSRPCSLWVEQWWLGYGACEVAKGVQGQRMDIRGNCVMNITCELYFHMSSDMPKSQISTQSYSFIRG